MLQMIRMAMRCSAVMINGDTGQVRHALGKLGERLETTVLEINEQGKEIDRLRVAVAGIFLLFILVLKDVFWSTIGFSVPRICEV